MKKFTYKARAEDGRPLSGKLEARDEKSAVELLRKRKMFVVEIKPQKENVEIPYISGLMKKVTHKQVVSFTRQLSTMITAGLSITNSLSILEAQSERTMGTVIAQILRDVEGGNTLSTSMDRHPKVFSKVYVALVKVGESAGVLDTVLKRLATNMEKQQEFRGQIKGALVYPGIVMMGMVVVGIVMMVFVIPKLTSMYKDFGAEVPLATQLLIGFSDFFTKFWYVLIGLVFAAGYAFRAWVNTNIGRYQFDQLMFKIPIIGPLRTEIVLTEFTRTFSLLVASGISILDGLAIVRDALGSPVFEKSLKEAAKLVEKGFPLASSLARDTAFPPIVSQMISVGEETGKLDTVLKKLSRYFEVESEQKVRALTTAIEPLIMVVLGFGVGFLVMAVILPIYNLTDQF